MTLIQVWKLTELGDPVYKFLLCNSLELVLSLSKGDRLSNGWFALTEGVGGDF
jgi:hypothetical protein